MSKIDIDTLLCALENDNNEGIIDYDRKKIDEIKNNVLRKLKLEKNDLKEVQTKLKDYKYVDELPDLQEGRYIRWISNKDPEKMYLANGGIVLGTKVVDGGMNIICKNNMNRIFEIKMKNNIVFQKLTNQEKVLLDVMNYLHK
jgi:hypothetical protein